MAEDIRLTEETSTQRRARLLGLDYINTSLNTPRPLFKQLLSIQELYTLRVIPIDVAQNKILFGITTTTSQQTMNSLTQRFLDQRVSYALISDTGFRDYMKLYDPPKQVVYQDITINGTATTNGSLIAKVSATLDQVKAADMLAYLTDQAHKLSASDIHVENQRDHVRIRFRIDGVLHPIAQLSHERSRMLTSAIASSANVSTSADEAQQGHITQKVIMADKSTVDVNLRVETVPAINGMDIVMRLFNMQADMYTLNKLGLNDQERAVVDSIIHKPSGLVLAVGPTGSGKTTTLYSMLNTLNTDSRKIITIEDPVEFQFSGITQISVKSKGSSESHFADNLRAVLRLDPDVVMVGEIRDNDTSKTALQASLTGHLVLSTFHASSAAAALTRMVDIIGQNPLFVSAIRLIMAQRLVRRLDDASKVAYQPDMAILKQLQDIINTFPPQLVRPNLDGITLYKPGSSAENPFGYSGQIALREQLVMSDPIRDMLSKPINEITTQKLETAAVQGGMLTMLHNAVLGLLAGQTTVDEVFRVLG
ncbi:Flp pilus assembly complex ATPase component TadA [Candidatus Saccharibacteria bacterium]|nr:Flp pilus assembly complex ATPase component TadA [Candidatus Saccharibacteria bacterium]